MAFEIQAHRGARAFYPENTLQAFCKAVDLGCRVIELDLNVSRDLRVVVSHDPWVNLLLAGEASRRSLYSMSYEEIAQFDCGEPSPDFPLQQRVRAVRPELHEVFSALEAHLRRAGRPGEMICNLEVKSWPELDGTAHPPPGEYAALVTRQIAASGFERRVRLQSFDARIIAEAKRLMPALSYGLLVEERSAFDVFPERPGFVPEYVNPRCDLVDEALVAWLHGLGAKVVAWTVNRPEEMLRMKRFGADGIITDHPEIALHLPGLGLD
ncbi:glycerophosphodiester phosphodiesterase [Chlorobaculum thiosulfatiphilum]|uniref:Glycerophosphodiester phosphodiesterase n=1 Tax=Chlorobaculum thiosulfatiphilum TaxID=115852 RepID=A0A5C4S7C0_CHLTI|nr:glycerophosphodiester phosphodiesterase family protein [Chlorobaculum thiosulfatiphilum]TNJ39018.1 glycerophosphodiester phosphodiesterase [Chlorobaculum thiosulfatiphilum]